MRTLIFICTVILLCSYTVYAEDEYAFDLSEIEKKPYSLSGYLQFNPVLYGLDKDSAWYKLKNYKSDEGDIRDEYNFTLQVDADYDPKMYWIYA